MVYLCLMFVIWTVVSYVHTLSTVNRYQHTIERSVLVDDHIEYDVESLFPNLKNDLRYSVGIPAEDQVLRIGQRTRLVEYKGIETIQKCSNFVKQSSNRYYGICSQTQVHLLMIDPTLREVTSILAFPKDLGPQRMIKDFTIDPTKRVVFILTLFNDIQGEEKAPVIEVTIHSIFKLGEPIAKLSFKPPQSLLPVERLSISFDLYERGHYLYVRNPGLSAYLGFVAIKLDQDKGTMELLGEYISTERQANEGEKEDPLAMKVRVMQGIFPKVKPIGLLETEHLGVIVAWKYYTSNTKYKITLQKCMITADFECKCSKMKRLNVNSTDETRLAYNFDNQVQIITYINKSEEDTTYLDSVRMVTITIDSIRVWRFSKDFMVSESSYLLENSQIKIMGIEAAGFETQNKIAIIARKDTYSSYLLVFDQKTFFIRFHKEPIIGDRIFFCLNERPGYDSGILAVNSVDQVVTTYLYKREVVFSSFLKTEFRDGQTEQKLKGGIIASRSEFANFNIEVLKSSDAKIAARSTLQSFKSITLFRGYTNGKLYVPFETISFRSSSPVINFESREGRDFKGTFENMQFTKVQKTQFYDKAINLMDYDNKTYIDIVSTLSYRNFTLIRFKNNTLELQLCLALTLRKSFQCKRLFNDHPFDFSIKILDFLALYKGEELFVFLLGSDEVAEISTMKILRLDMNSQEQKVDHFGYSSFSPNLIDGSLSVNRTHILMIGTTQLEQSKPEYLSIITFTVDLDTLQLPRGILEHDKRVKLPESSTELKEFKRTQFNAFILVMEQPGRSIFVHNYTFVGWESTQTVVFHISVELYHYIGLAGNCALVMRREDKALLARSRGFTSGEEKLLVAKGLLTEEKDIGFFVAIGRTAFLCVKDSLYVLDMAGSSVDPVERVIQSKKLEYSLTSEDRPLVWVMGHLTLFINFIHIVPIDKNEKLKAPSDSYVFDLYGPDFFLELEVSPSARSFSPIRYTLLQKKEGEETVITQYTLPRLILKSECSLLSVAPISNTHHHSKASKAGVNEYLIKDIMAINSHIANYSLIEEQDSERPLAKITQAIEKVDTTDQRTFFFPNRSLQEGETIRIVGNFILILSRDKLEIFKVKYTNVNGKKSKFTDLVRSMPIEFKYTSFILAQDTTEKSRALVLIFTVPSRFDAFNLVVFSFEDSFSGRLSKKTFENACQCASARVESMSRSGGLVRFAFQYLKHTLHGNYLVFSVLDLNTAKGEDSSAEGQLEGSFTDSVHSQYLNYRVLDFNLLTSEDTVLQYFFIQNSGHIGIVFLALDQSMGLARAHYSMQKFSSDFVLTRHSLIDCKLENQQLTLKCLFQSYSSQAHAFSTTFRFMLDDTRLVASRSEYTLLVPLGYRPVKLKKGDYMDIMYAVDESKAKTCALFYNISTRLVVHRICEDELPGGKISLKTSILETDDKLLAVINEGQNLRDSIYEVVEPKITLSQEEVDSRRREGYFGNYLKVQGLEDNHETILLLDIFEFQYDVSVWWYVTAWGVFFLMLSCCIVLFCYHKSSPKDHDFEFDADVEENQSSYRDSHMRVKWANSKSESLLIDQSK